MHIRPDTAIESTPSYDHEYIAGSWPVMLTPFDAALNIDWKGLDALIEWYIAAGSQGLFGICYSSEMFMLDENERLALVRHIAARTAGRVPFIAAGAFPSGTPHMQSRGSPAGLADSAHALAEAGASAVIFLTNQFADAQDDDARWLDNLSSTLTRIDPAVQLGLYECPLPYKRLLTPATTRWAAATGRFRFLKDTCCDVALIKAKLLSIQNSPLRFYNANTPTLLASLQAGGHGFSGVGDNAVPQLYAWLCENFQKLPEQAAQLQAFLVESSPVVDIHYPHSVKTYLHSQGLPIETHSRLCENAMTPLDVKNLAAFHAAVSDWEKRLKIPSPFALIQ